MPYKLTSSYYNMYYVIGFLNWSSIVHIVCSLEVPELPAIGMKCFCLSSCVVGIRYAPS